MYTAVGRFRGIGVDAHSFDRLYWNIDQAAMEEYLSQLGTIILTDEGRLARFVSLTLSRGLAASDYGVSGTQDFYLADKTFSSHGGEYVIVKSYIMSVANNNDMTFCQKSTTQKIAMVSGDEYKNIVGAFSAEMFEGAFGGIEHPYRVCVVHPLGNTIEPDHLRSDDMFFGGEGITIDFDARVLYIDGTDEDITLGDLGLEDGNLTALAEAVGMESPW